MIKRLICGDIHGRYDVFKNIYDKEQPDEVVILGDYFDTHENISPEDMINSYINLRDIQIKHKESGKIFIRLLGNHDFHYIGNGEQYSGFNWHYSTFAFNEIKRDLDEGLLQICYIDIVNHILFTHAGVTNTWMNHWGIEDPIDINKVNLNALKFTYAGNGDCYGDSLYSSPIWVRPYSLYEDHYKDWYQIFGHTHSIEPIKVSESLIGLDCLPYYYCIEELDDERNLINRSFIKNE